MHSETLGVIRKILVGFRRLWHFSVTFGRGGECLAKEESIYSIQRLSMRKQDYLQENTRPLKDFFQSYDSGVNMQIIIFD